MHTCIERQHRFNNLAKRTRNCCQYSNFTWELFCIQYIQLDVIVFVSFGAFHCHNDHTQTHSSLLYVCACVCRNPTARLLPLSIFACCFLAHANGFKCASRRTIAGVVRPYGLQRWGRVSHDVYQCFRVFVAAWIDSSAQVSRTCWQIFAAFLCQKICLPQLNRLIEFILALNLWSSRFSILVFFFWNWILKLEMWEFLLNNFLVTLALRIQRYIFQLLLILYKMWYLKLSLLSMRK